MAIIAWPEDIDMDEIVSCVACDKNIPLIEATAGLWDFKSNQAFACNRHFLSGTTLIRSWAAFSIAQERELGVGGTNTVISMTGR